ncbi:MAG: ATP-binding protein [Planctomycetales bacterium]|nr:ATP-binding protein [Planctomycetales bacterium]
MLANLQSCLASDGENVNTRNTRETWWKVSGLSFQPPSAALEHGKVCHERQIGPGLRRICAKIDQEECALSMAHDVNQSEMDVVARVRSALVDRISPERYDLWIPDQTTWAWHDQTLKLSFPSQFTCQLAKKMLQRDLAEVAMHATAIECVVAFEVQASASVQLAASQSAEPSRSPGNRKLTSTAEVGKSIAAPATAPPWANPTNLATSTAGAASSMEADLWLGFVRGSSNELAWTTANLAVNEPGRLTPVLIHGPSGSGKSLLTTAIAQQLRSVRRLRRVVHMTSEQFTNDFMEGLRGGGLPMFRRKYRDVEALLLDDIQFLAGKKSTLAEVKHTLDNLLRLGKQVVFTADRPLNELSALGSDLVGRLRGGLVSPLFPLDEETRNAVLRRLLNEEGIALEPDIVSNLASRAAGDGRILAGIAKRLTATASVEPGKLTWDRCWNAVFDLVQATQPIVRIGDIERVVCSVFGLEPESLQSPSKMRSVSQPRMLAMFLARKYTPAAYKEIGEYFGKRRHSTVISAEKTVESWLGETAEVACGRGLTVRDALRHVESQLQVG